MKVKIYTEKEFERQLRKLSKKYRSMLDDYDAFLPLGMTSANFVL